MSETASDIWSDDLLDRKREAKFIVRFLINRSAEHKEAGRNRSYVLNIDGAWGQGKTFFLDRLHQDLLNNDYLSVYVNAWKDDHADDPMIAVMSAIDTSLKSRLSKRTVLRKTWDVTRRQGMKIAVTAATYGMKKLSTKLIGEGAEAITDIVKENAPEIVEHGSGAAEDAVKKLDAQIEKIVDRRSEKALKEFNDTKISAENFRKNLGTFIDGLTNDGSIHQPLFILIDELDRCRPPYAIATLERIKHFFDVPNVVFVIATDSSQLRHSIRAVYGEGFDSQKYLLRFFDRVYHFSAPSKNALVEFLFSSQPLRSGTYASASVPEARLFQIYAEIMGLTLRDIEQCYDHLRTICTTWNYKRPAQLIYIIPLVMLFQQGEVEAFELLRNGGIHPTLEKRLQNSPALSTHQYRAGHGGYGTRIVKLSDVLQYFLNHASGTFRHALESTSQYDWQHAIRQYFVSEFAEDHQNRTSSAEGKSEILATYETVVSSGKFVFNPEDEEA